MHLVFEKKSCFYIFFSSMLADFSLRPPKNYGPIFAKKHRNFLAKNGPKFFGGLNEK